MHSPAQPLNDAPLGGFSVSQQQAITMDLDAMDYVRGAIANAMVEDMSLQDIWACAEHAQSPQSFDDAINELAGMMEIPHEQ